MVGQCRPDTSATSSSLAYNEQIMTIYCSKQDRLAYDSDKEDVVSRTKHTGLKRREGGRVEDDREGAAPVSST